MSNLRILALNAVDNSDSVLSCSVAVTLPLDNMKNPARERVCRVPADPAFALKGTLTTAVNASMVQLLRTNLSSAATCRFRGYPNDDWTGTPVDTGTVTAIESTAFNALYTGPKHWTAFFASTSIKSWQIDVTDTANVDGYVDVSRAKVGDYFELTYNPVYGMKLGWKSESTVWPTDGGGSHTDRLGGARLLNFDLEGIPEADRIKWMEIFGYCDSAIDVSVIVYPGGTSAQIRDYTLSGIIMPPLPDLTTVGLNRDSTNITIRES